MLQETDVFRQAQGHEVSKAKSGQDDGEESQGWRLVVEAACIRLDGLDTSQFDMLLFFGSEAVTGPLQRSGTENGNGNVPCPWLRP